MGVDRVLADLRRAAALPAHPAVGAMLAAVVGQAHRLRPSPWLGQPGYVARQLCLQAAELGEDRLASDLRARLRSQPGPGLVPLWTTRRASRALSVELGRHDGGVGAVAVLPDGRVVTGGGGTTGGCWCGTRPGRAAARSSSAATMSGVRAVAVLPDGRVVSGGGDRRVLVWDPARAGGGPVELGRHDDAVRAVAVLPDGRVVTGGWDRRVLVWDPARAGGGPVELGRHDGPVVAVAVLPDGRVVSGGWRTTGGCWCGTRPGRAAARSSSAATTARWRRWRCCRTGGWSAAAGTTGGCWCGTRPGRAAARSSSAATTAVCGRWRCCRTGGWSPAAEGRRAGAGVGPGPGGQRPGRARPPRRPGGGGGGAAGRAGGHRRRRVDGRVLVWDPARAGSGPAELGRHDGAVAAVAVLPDGRVVTGGGRYDRRVLVWDPARRRRGPAELGRHNGTVAAVAVLPDGRVVSGRRV